IPGGKILCTDMKKTTLENLYSTLKNMENEVIVEDEIMEKALNSLLNMHKLAEG
ncbi:quinolinate synthase NadA, partial [Clostridioides difficile]